MYFATVMCKYNMGTQRGRAMIGKMITTRVNPQLMGHANLNFTIISPAKAFLLHPMMGKIVITRVNPQLMGHTKFHNNFPC